MAAKKQQVSKAKAKKILRDGSVRGQHKSAIEGAINDAIGDAQLLRDDLRSLLEDAEYLIQAQLTAMQDEDERA